MSRAIVTNIDDAANNNYILQVPKLGSVSGQCVTNDEITVGMEVRIVDMDNTPPSIVKQFGNIRFLPNSHPDQTTTPEYVYQNGGVWKSSSELWNTNNKFNLAKAYILNKRWQKEYPLYKRGKVTEIIDEKYMRVEIVGDMNRKCRTDYMTCDTAAFEVDDVTVVFYENGSYNKPVVIGFWDSPIDCLPELYPRIVFGWKFDDITPFDVYVTNIEFSTDGISWNSFMGTDYWITTTFEGFPVYSGGQYGWTGLAEYTSARFTIVENKIEELTANNYIRVTWNATETLTQAVLVLWSNNPIDPESYAVVNETPIYTSGTSINFDWYTPV